MKKIGIGIALFATAVGGYFLLKPKKKYYIAKRDFTSKGVFFKSGVKYEGKTYEGSTSVFLLVNNQFIEVPSNEVDLILGQTPSKL